MFEKHLKKTTNGYVYVAKRCWIQNVQGVYLFNFALLPIGRQGMADIFSVLRLFPLAAVQDLQIVRQLQENLPVHRNL
jgi:hypothetical protein